MDHFFVAGTAPETAVAQIRARRPEGSHQIHVLADLDRLSAIAGGEICPVLDFALAEG